MIYTKKANFPYPILMNFMDDYKNAKFELDVDLKENQDNYIIELKCDISSYFIKKQLKKGVASLILIIKSKDNKFMKLDYLNKMQVAIKKSRLCINARTVMQLMIQTNTDIDFSDNNDLDEFYNEIKSEIRVEAGMVLGFSNTVIFDGSQQKPYDLFEKKVDKSLKNDFEIRIGDETIMIVYKDESLQFTDMQNSRELNYPYIYAGLQKALTRFIIHANPGNPEDGVYIEEMEPPENALDSKLFRLMQAKNIQELNLSNIDEVIYQISDNLIRRYADSVRRIQNGN